MDLPIVPLVVGLAVGLFAGSALGITGCLAVTRRRPALDHTEPAAEPPRPAEGGLEYVVAQPCPIPACLDRRSLHTLQVGVLVLDTDNRPVLANPAAKSMGLVRGAATIGGGRVAPAAVRALADRTRRTGAWLEADLDLPGGGAGDPLGVSIRAVALDGGFVTMEASDVTEAHRLARVRRDFVANVSHELKTPVGALQLLAEALLDATAETTATAEAADAATGDPTAGPAEDREDLAATRRFVDRIHHESIRLGRLVNDLIELSRLEGSEPLPDPSPVPVDQIVTEVIDRARTPAGAKGIDVTFTGTRGLTVYGNEHQLTTALANLVDNAVAYTPDRLPDQPVPTVTISATVDDQHVGLAVIDRGIGIAPKDLDRIFERFYRADKARSRSTGGTGLGLAIVKHIATNHGGRVEVTSVPGTGSTFTLWLPARPVGDAGPPDQRGPHGA